jgi:hypothetical protein
MEEFSSTANDTRDTLSFVLIDTHGNNFDQTRMNDSLSSIADSETVRQRNSTSDSIGVYIEFTKRSIRVHENKAFSNQQQWLCFLLGTFDSSGESRLPSRVSISLFGAISMLDPTSSSVATSSSPDKPNL